MSGDDQDITDLLKRSIELAKAENPAATVTPIHPETDLAQPCCAASKLRSVDADGTAHFESWCIVHHHWLNGRAARSVMDREIEYLRSKHPESFK